MSNLLPSCQPVRNQSHENLYFFDVDYFLYRKDLILEVAGM